LKKYQNAACRPTRRARTVPGGVTGCLSPPAGSACEVGATGPTILNKLSRTYVVLLDALNRHRGKGQQKVTVEHVHVHSGGQAVVGMVGAGGVGAHPKLAEQPHAKQIAYAPQPPMQSADKARERVPIARDAERPVSPARRKVAGRSQG
jgi:hypothetical protein